MSNSSVFKLYGVLGLVLVTLGCQTPKKETASIHPAQKTARAHSDAAIAGTKAPSPRPKASVRKRSVFPGGDQSRRAWAKRLMVAERFEKTLCRDDAYLRTCVRSFRHPHTRVLGPFTRRDCFDAVRNVVSKELGMGRGKLGLVGAFLSEELPATIKAGRDMDVYADRLARRIFDVLLPAFRKYGGTLDASKNCLELKAQSQEVNGN